MEPAARSRTLSKIYGQDDTRVVALDEVDVDLAAAEFTAIMGPSGSGKSTLMHCLAGLDQASGGEVFIGDTELTSLSDKALTKLRRSQVGFVFQSFNLVPTLTAKENITLPVDIAGNKIDQEWFDTVVDTVGLRDRLGHKPTELSGGQQQRVAVARAVAAEPAIVLADEPTANLDSRTGDELLDMMQKLNKDFGTTFLFSTHDPQVMERATRLVRLHDGQIESDERR